MRSRSPRPLGSGFEPLEDRSLTATLSVGDVTLTEGASGVQYAAFAVRVAGTHGAVSVKYATQSGTAQAGLDFGSTSGTLNFKANEFEKVVNVPVYGDKIGEADESFQLKLSAAAGATLSRATATATIVSDDPRTFVFLFGGYVLPTQSPGQSGLEKLKVKLDDLNDNAIILPVRYHNYDVTAARAGIAQTLSGARVTALDRVVLIGHSSGGDLAYQLASDVNGAGRKASAVVLLDPIGEGLNKNQSSVIKERPSGVAAADIFNIVQRNYANDSWLNSYGYNVRGVTSNTALAGGSNGATHNSLDDNRGIGQDLKDGTADDTVLGVYDAIFTFVGQYVAKL